MQTANDPIAKAIAMLEMLPEDTRQTVLARMDDATRSRVEARILETQNRPHAAFTKDIASQRRLMRETARRIQEERLHKAQEESDEALTNPIAAIDGELDPLAQLGALHPAAIARAMQGERAEAWAIVLDRLAGNARHALASYLDPAAHRAIEAARGQHQTLNDQNKTTIERAIARTIVPRAVREHNALMSAQWRGQ
jgi:flagellar motor switch protein FliG